MGARIRYATFSSGVRDMQRWHVAIMAVFVSGLASGCAQRVVSESGGDVSVGASTESWGTTFRGRDGWNDTRGSVFAKVVEGGTQVALTVEGGIAGSRYGWDLREGACGANGRAIGDAAKYSPVLLGDRGMGSTITIVPVTFETGKQYSVNLYGDPTERTIVIGCGNLAR